MPQRWRAPIALITLALLFACLKGRSPTDTTANDVRFDLHAQVSGASVLHITVVYLDQVPNTETTVPVMLLDQRLNVAAGTQSLPLTIDLTRCLADPQHITGTTCELLAGVVLEQNGQAVDSVGVGPVTVTPGQTVHAGASLVPVGRVVVYPHSASLTIGAITPLGDSVFSPSNVYLPNTAVTWTSADPTIAKVNANGAVTGVAGGTTTVKASAGGQSDSATITVASAVTPDTVVINVPGGLPGISFSAQAGSTTPGGAPLEITSKNTGIISGLASKVTYTAGQPTGWLIANVSDSVPYFFGQRVRGSRIRLQLRRQTSGSSFVTPGVVDIVPSTTSLAIGTYTATVTVSGTNATSASITVTYTISAAGAVLSFAPNPVIFNQYAYGATPVGSQKTLAVNSGSGTLGTISEAGSIGYSGRDTGWVNVLTVAGDSVVLQPKTTALQLGTDTARIPFAASGASGTSTLVATVSSFVTFTKIQAGAAFACGLTTAGTVYCWGDNTYGVLGTGASAFTTPDTLIPARVLLPTTPSNLAVDIAVGGYHACAILANHSVYCWGENNQGQLGIGTSDLNAHPTPAQIPGATYSQISAGSYHTCGIEGTGGVNYVDCWGDNNYGELGLDVIDGNPHPTPTNTGYIDNSVSAGGQHTCVLNSGHLYCWGSNTYGELGIGTTGPPQPAAVSVTVNPTGLATNVVSAGPQNTCALDANGLAYCWGDNTDGQIANGSTSNTPVTSPSQVPSLQFTAISSGSLMTCGLAIGGVEYCWGNDALGQLGNGTTGGNFVAPVSVASPSAPTQITTSVGGQFACYVSSTGAYCFGYDYHGDLGIGVTSLGPTSSTNLPFPVFGQPAPLGVGPSRVVHPPTARRPARK